MNIARLENQIVVVSETVGVSVYDFDFDLNFQTSHPYAFDLEETCILRIGAIDDYDTEFANKLELGLRLINDPQQHRMASELEYWYPLIQDLTPKSVVYETLPDDTVIEEQFGWPVFIKGSRQTSKHSAALSIASDPAAYRRIVMQYAEDSILHWQKPVVRQFVPLEPVTGEVPNQVAPSNEYRSFWLNGECVGWGRYWYQIPEYKAQDIDVGLAMARQAVERLQVPFIVVDIAKTASGEWIIIECNDAQESGYVGINARMLWSSIIDQLSRHSE